MDLCPTWFLPNETNDEGSTSYLPKINDTDSIVSLFPVHEQLSVMQSTFYK